MATQPDYDPRDTPAAGRPRTRSLLVSVPDFDADSAIAAIAAGGLAILADGVGADAQLSLVAAAQDIEASAVNFMARNGRGLICMPVAPEHARRLGLTPMVAAGSNPRCHGFARSIEACSGVSTGISADDRARTMSVAAAPNADPRDLISPGHVFPVIGHEGGLLGRCDATEAAIELVRLAGRGSAGVLCRILRDDGEVATLADMHDLRWMRSLAIVDLGTLVAAQCRRIRLIRRDEAPRFVGGGTAIQVRCYCEENGGRQHYALLRGGTADRERSVIRVCRDNDAGEDICAVVALSTVIGEGLSDPGASLILVSARKERLAGDIVNQVIGGLILEDMVRNG